MQVISLCRSLSGPKWTLPSIWIPHCTIPGLPEVGGSLFRSLLDAGLVDAVEVAVIPVLLGGGLPLLPPPANRARLKLVGTRTYKKTGTLSLEYAVENAGPSTDRP